MTKTIDLTIEQTGEKGRAFTATCLAYVEADALWTGGGGNNIRPVFAALAGSPSELTAFLANWQGGRRASYPKYRSGKDMVHLELLKSVTYRRADQRLDDAMASTIFLPDLFAHDMGLVDPTGVSFLCMPPADWLDEATREHDLDAAVAPYAGEISGGMHHDRAFARLAIAVLSQLDRRTRAPVLQTAAFAVQMLRRLFDDQLAATPVDHDSYSATWGLRAFGLDNIGAAGCVAIRGTHEALEQALAEEARDYLRAQARRAA